MSIKVNTAISSERITIVVTRLSVFRFPSIILYPVLVVLIRLHPVLVKCFWIIYAEPFGAFAIVFEFRRYMSLSLILVIVHQPTMFAYCNKRIACFVVIIDILPFGCNHFGSFHVLDGRYFPVT